MLHWHLKKLLKMFMYLVVISGNGGPDERLGQAAESVVGGGAVGTVGDDFLADLDHLDAEALLGAGVGDLHLRSLLINGILLFRSIYGGIFFFRSIYGRILFFGSFYGGILLFYRGKYRLLLLPVWYFGIFGFLLLHNNVLPGLDEPVPVLVPVPISVPVPVPAVLDSCKIEYSFKNLFFSDTVYFENLLLPSLISAMSSRVMASMMMAATRTMEKYNRNFWENCK